MTPILLLPRLFLAGGAILAPIQAPVDASANNHTPAREKKPAGVAFLAPLQASADSSVDNHTLAGEKISPSQVVTRSLWGTPMLPDGKGGYSLIAPIDKKLIAQSLWIPPVFGTRPAVEAAAPSVPAPEVPATTVTVRSDQSASGATTTPSLPLPAASPVPSPAAISQ